MSKCLVTKLKAVVDNPDLPVLGEITFHLKRVKDNGDNIYLNPISSETPIVATILGDNDIVFKSNNAKTKIITSFDGLTYIGGNIGDTFYMRLVNKYNISNWNLQNNGSVYANAVSPLFPPGALKYHNNITSIGTDMCGIVIPISDLIASGNVIRSIHNGGNACIYGDYEDYLATIWKNGRKTDTLKLERIGNRTQLPTAPSQVSFGDNLFGNVTFNKDNIKIDLRIGYESTVVIATGTYNGSTWSYQMNS